MDEQGVVDFLMKLTGDAAAAAGGLSVAVGDRLWALPGDGRRRTADRRNAGAADRVRRAVHPEWLAVQAGLGYVEYDPAEQTFTLPDEHATVLADENSPTFLPGCSRCSAPCTRPRTGWSTPSGWAAAWAGTSTPTRLPRYRESFRPGYRQNIVDAWLPALDGVVASARGGPGRRHRLRLRSRRS